MKKRSRPFLLTGLILSLLCYILYAISSFIAINTVFAIFAGTGDAIFETAAIMSAAIIIILLVVAILGIVFSSISLARVGLPAKEFVNKKGLIITTFVFDIIFCVLLLFGFFSQFSVISLLIFIALLVSSIFIMIDVKKNNKYLEEESNEEQKLNLEIKVENKKEEKHEEVNKEKENDINDKNDSKDN